MKRRVWREPQLAELQRQFAEEKLIAIVAKALACEPVATCQVFETMPIGEAMNLGTGDSNSRFIQGIPTTLWPRGWTYQNMANIARIQFDALDGFDATREIVLPRIEDAAFRKFESSFVHRSPYKLLAAIAFIKSSKTRITAAVNQARMDQGQIACALDRYRLAHGNYPDTLNALVPRFMEKIPHDVIEGRPMHYRRVTEQSFLLYSVGWNGTDDGGVQTNDRELGDWVWKN